MGRDLLLRLEDMRDGILATYDLTKGMTEKGLLANSAVYWSCQNRIGVVAEAAKEVPRGLRVKHPEVDWRGLIGMGDVLRHKYFRVETNIVWGTVKVDFPVLLKVVERLLKEERAKAMA